MIYHVEHVHSVRVNEKDWTRQYPDICFVDVDLDYINDDEYEMKRETFTMDIEDWWIVEEYGYFSGV